MNQFLDTSNPISALVALVIVVAVIWLAFKLFFKTAGIIFRLIVVVVIIGVIYGVLQMI